MILNAFCCNVVVVVPWFVYQSEEGASSSVHCAIVGSLEQYIALFAIVMVITGLASIQS